MADVIQLGPVQGLVNILWSRESELPALPSLQKSSTTKHLGLSLPCKFFFFSPSELSCGLPACFFLVFFSDGHPLNLF